MTEHTRPSLSGAAPLDLIFTNARVVDGTGNPWFTADVGVRGDAIAAVGRLDGTPAARRIDAAGKVLCPGFVDVHVHSELGILSGALTEARIRQGVTTDLMSPDGFSLAPLSPERLREMREYLASINGDVHAPSKYQTYRDYLSSFDGRIGLNVLPQVPFNTLRAEVVGWEVRPATPAETERMGALAAEIMEAGATGLQLGLEYHPSGHATTAELVAVAKPVAERGGVVSAHMRGYGDLIEKSVEEMRIIARGTGARIHFSHFLYTDTADAAHGGGLDLTFDTYPYMASSTMLLFLLPRDVVAGSPAEIIERLAHRSERKRWEAGMREFMANRRYALDDMVFASLGAPESQRFLGMSFALALKESGQSLIDFTCDLLIRDRLATLMIFHWQNEERLRKALTHPLQMVSSDGIFNNSGRPHPRGYGAFPRFLRMCVRERRWLSLEDAIRRMTGFPAARFGLHNRGLVRQGMAADLVLFDPHTVTDRATFEDGRRYAEGIEYVVVNGQLALDGGRMTGANAGRVLRGGRGG